MAKKENGFKLSRINKKIVLALLFLFFFNIFFAVFSFSFLQDFWFFASKSIAYILSDLLFFEGAILFAVGAFVASGLSIFKIEKASSLYASPEGHAEYLRESRKKQFKFGTVLIAIGAILIGSSIAIGTLLI